MEKGKIFELTIDDISNEGSGIGRVDGLVVFVPGVLPGDCVRVRLIKVKKSYAIAELEEIIESSEHRVTDFDCPYCFGVKNESNAGASAESNAGASVSINTDADAVQNTQACGGCPYAELEYDMQCRIKEKQVRDKLERIAGIKFRDECGVTGGASHLDGDLHTDGKLLADEDSAEDGTLCSDESNFAVFNPIIRADESKEQIVDSPEIYSIYGYRNKAAMPISTGGLETKKGGIVCPVHEPRIGFRPTKSHEVIDCESCLLQADTAMAAARATRHFMIEDNICSFDKRWGKGLMKSMTVKTAFGTGEVMVVYDINGKGIPNAAKLIEYLDSAIYDAGGNLESVIIKTENKSAQSGTLKKGTHRESHTKSEVFAGKPTITDIIEIDGREIRFEISADSFYQVNHMQMQNLYSLVRKYCMQVAGIDWHADGANCQKAEELLTQSYKASSSQQSAQHTSVQRPIVLDLYCGIGTIGLCVADIAKHVYGIEIVKQAVLDANRNATINGIVNATYSCGKAEEKIGELLEEINNKRTQTYEAADDRSECIGEAGEGSNCREVPIIAVLDPPRAGCKEELLQAVAEAGIQSIIYVSCDPATLARDVKVLRELGYELREATPVDMFPHTSHVECVALLTLK